ncbi:hypothetical protein BDR26DRAFT_987333 [Obelidium mucronatum]|nr:hypothetical protein BDR26DRAFT_987333 [Obelidium mucronatum]
MKNDNGNDFFDIIQDRNESCDLSKSTARNPHNAAYALSDTVVDLLEIEVRLTASYIESITIQGNDFRHKVIRSTTAHVTFIESLTRLKRLTRYSSNAAETEVLENIIAALPAKAAITSLAAHGFDEQGHDGSLNFRLQPHLFVNITSLDLLCMVNIDDYRPIWSPIGQCVHLETLKLRSCFDDNREGMFNAKDAAIDYKGLVKVQDLILMGYGISHTLCFWNALPVQVLKKAEILIWRYEYDQGDDDAAKEEEDWANGPQEEWDLPPPVVAQETVGAVDNLMPRIKESNNQQRQHCQTSRGVNEALFFLAAPKHVHRLSAAPAAIGVLKVRPKFAGFEDSRVAQGKENLLRLRAASIAHSFASPKRVQDSDSSPQHTIDSGLVHYFHLVPGDAPYPPAYIHGIGIEGNDFRDKKLRNSTLLIPFIESLTNLKSLTLFSSNSADSGALHKVIEALPAKAAITSLMAHALYSCYDANRERMFHAENSILDYKSLTKLRELILIGYGIAHTLCFWNALPFQVLNKATILIWKYDFEVGDSNFELDEEDWAERAQEKWKRVRGQQAGAKIWCRASFDEDQVWSPSWSPN